MDSESRRQSILAAIEPLLREYGPSVSTRQIAEAAGVAEGTLFRAFADKNEIIGEALMTMIDFDSIMVQLEASRELVGARERLTRIVSVLASRVEDLGSIMGLLSSQEMHEIFSRHKEIWKEWGIRMGRLTTELLTPFSDQLTLPPRQAAVLVQAICRTASSPKIAGQESIKADTISQVLLDGILVRPTNTQN